jgi:hypothetical protein
MRRRLLSVTALCAAGAVALGGCTDAPSPVPTVFERPAEAGDAVPGSIGASYQDSRLVGTWRGDSVYLAVPEGGMLICIVVAGDGGTASACADGPPLELDGSGDYRFDLDVPDARDGWQAIGPDVYAR